MRRALEIRDPPRLHCEWSEPLCHEPSPATSRVACRRSTVVLFSTSYDVLPSDHPGATGSGRFYEHARPLEVSIQQRSRAATPLHQRWDSSFRPQQCSRKQVWPARPSKCSRSKLYYRCGTSAAASTACPRCPSHRQGRPIRQPLSAGRPELPRPRFVCSMYVSLRCVIPLRPTD